MAPLVPRLRRWLAVLGILLVTVVAITYFAARHRVQNALKQVPEKIGIEVQQSAKGFTISKSFQGRTMFKIEASKAIQFKQGGRTELQNVEITVYGRDSNRFDRITGKDFEYNAQTGEVLGKGEVKIDLEANPSGSGEPDQSPPSDLKTPVHVTTTDLIFNQKTGNASSTGRIEFSLPGADGSAVGLQYDAESHRLALLSEVALNIGGFSALNILADSAILSNVPRMLLIKRPRLREGSNTAGADQATVFFSMDEKVSRVLARGNVRLESSEGDSVTAVELDIAIDGRHNTLRKAMLSEDVRLEKESSGMQGNAGRVILDFVGKNRLGSVHADQGVTLLEHARTSGKSAPRRDLKITSATVDLTVRGGKIVQRADTSGSPEITISSRDPTQESTTITAEKFRASFDTQGHLNDVYGVPHARVINKVRGNPDRTSTSESIDAKFEEGVGITTLKQVGNFVYVDGSLRARADSAQYSPDSEVLILTGFPAVIDSSMATSAQTIKLNHITMQATAEGNVKTSYSSKKSDRASFLGSSDPIHATADKMTTTGNPTVAHYSGNVRLWQNSNQLQAPEIAFDRERHSITANSVPGQRVSARLFQIDKKGRSVPIVISSDRLTYGDEQRTVQFRGNVTAESSNIRTVATEMDCLLKPQIGPGSQNDPGGLDQIVARHNVVITQAGRRVTGTNLVYTSADDKFVMTGGPPSIFDAERGNVTGDSLTLYGHDGRVLVEGSKQSPTITVTRVAR